MINYIPGLDIIITLDWLNVTDLCHYTHNALVTSQVQTLQCLHFLCLMLFTPEHISMMHDK